MNDTAPAPGTVYLIHFDTPYKQARHYIGNPESSASLKARWAARGSEFGGPPLLPPHGPEPCPGVRVPLPEKNPIDDGFDEHCLICVVRSPVGAAVTLDEQFGDGPAVVAAGELGLVYATPGPAAVQEQPVILDEGQPFVVHVPSPVASADSGPFPARPASWRRRDGLRQRHGGKASELIPPDYRLFLHLAHRTGRRATKGGQTSPESWAARRSRARADGRRVRKSRRRSQIPESHVAILIGRHESPPLTGSPPTPSLSCKNTRKQCSHAPTNSRQLQQWTADLDARLSAHRAGHGSRLMEVITGAGISWQLARTWEGDRTRERAIKNRKEAPRLCPLCTATPRPVTTGRSAPPVQPGTLILPVPAQVSPRERGLRQAGQFLGQRAGWSPDQLAASFDYITGPYRDMPRHTPGQDEAFSVFSAAVAGHITSLRAMQNAPALRGKS